MSHSSLRVFWASWCQNREGKHAAQSTCGLRVWQSLTSLTLGCKAITKCYPTAHDILKKNWFLLDRRHKCLIFHMPFLITHFRFSEIISISHIRDRHTIKFWPCLQKHEMNWFPKSIFVLNYTITLSFPEGSERLTSVQPSLPSTAGNS